VVNEALSQMGSRVPVDNVQEMLDDVAATASGVLGGVGGLVNGNTMALAGGLASGRVST
jgi:hypothetical protein